MKKLTFILAAAMTLFSQAAFAQGDDPMLFNHLAIGASAGFDGVGGNIALPIGNHFGIRAGYSTLPKTAFVDQNFEVNDVVTLNTRELQLETVAVHADASISSGNVLLDLYPGKRSGFHFTVGGYYAFNTQPINVTGDMRQDPVTGKQYLAPEEYGHVFANYNDLKRVTTDMDGFVHADLNVGSFMPYVGLGFGRGVKADKRVSILLDLGVLYAGDSFSVNTYDIDDQPVYMTSASVSNKDDGLIDDLMGVGVIPMLKLSIFVKLF